MRRISAAVIALGVLSLGVQADDKKYLSCTRAREEVFPLVVSAITEKWTIQNVNEKLYMITAAKEDKKGKLWGGQLAGNQDAIVTIMLKDNPAGGTLVEVKATKNRSGDAQKNLLKFLPAGECDEHKPSK
jgi:hypothetical protein